MANINKFPSGLNNWADTDKPKREHFVSDNQILDEDAMWKADYDDTGEVGEVGIVEFVQDYVTEELMDISNSINECKPNTLAFYITAGAWSGSGPYTQTASVVGLLSTDTVMPSISPQATITEIEARDEARLQCTAQANDSLTFTAYGDKPSVNLPMQVTYWR